MKNRNRLVFIVIMIFLFSSLTACTNDEKINANTSELIHNSGQASENIKQENEGVNSKILEVEVSENNEEQEQEHADNEPMELKKLSLKELNSDKEKYMDAYVKIEGTIDYIDEEEIICEIILTDGSEYVDIEYFDSTDYFKGDYITIEGIVSGCDDTQSINEKPVSMAIIEATKVGNIAFKEIETVEPEIVDCRTKITGNYVFSKSDKDKLTNSEINDLDNYTLLIARNEIFARHGYSFKTPEIREYFTDKEWYKEDVNYKGKLNSIETYNVNLILKEENSR